MTAAALVLLGPPGTGKTTTLLTRIEALLTDGVNPEEIAFVSFTKAACAEARDRAARRFGLEEEQLVHFRTIHSMALRMLGGPRMAGGEIMSDRHWKHFAECCKYAFTAGSSTETPFFPAFETDSDQIRQIHEISRMCLCPIEKAMLRVPRAPNVSADDVREYVKRIHEFKTEHALIDFTDMLEIALRREKKPPVSHAFVDEAQDLCPLQHALIDHWFVRSRCERVTYAGDDDQAIYNWAGADPDRLISLAREFPCTTLDQSYRIPAGVHRMAMSIVGQNRNRIEKAYSPRVEEGVVRTPRGVREALADPVGETMALVRNVRFATEFREEAMAAAVFFSSEVGPKAPLDRVATKGAYDAISRMRASLAVRASDFAHLLDQVPTKVGDRQILPRGVKARVAENEAMVDLDRARSEFGLGDFVAAILDSESPCEGVLLRLEGYERQYLDRVMRRYGPSLPDRPSLTITTMHRSKGREASTVILCSDMAGASHREFLHGDTESENRVAYVAVTRAKNELRVVQPQTGRSYPFASHLRH